MTPITERDGSRNLTGTRLRKALNDFEAREMFNFDKAKTLRNIVIRGLEYEVEDDQFIQIIEEMSRLIAITERQCNAAFEQGDDAAGESACDYLEELIGISFVILQTKIRRVVSAVERLRKATNQDPISITLFRIRLFWDMANYYKHRDEWSAVIWRDKGANEKRESKLEQARQTRRSVERLGIVMVSSGNLRTSYEKLGIEPYSDCRRLAIEVQDWARQVLKDAIATAGM